MRKKGTEGRSDYGKTAGPGLDLLNRWLGLRDFPERRGRNNEEDAQYRTLKPLQRPYMGTIAERNRDRRKFGATQSLSLTSGPGGVGH